MNTKKLATLALMGIASTALLNAECTSSECTKGAVAANNTMPAMGNMTADQQAFADKLSAAAKEKFKAMSTEERAMAMKVAQSACKGKNECKGLGVTGTNACKGQGTCKVTDANKAVDLVSNKMAAKRANSSY